MDKRRLMMGLTDIGGFLGMPYRGVSRRVGEVEMDFDWDNRTGLRVANGQSEDSTASTFYLTVRLNTAFYRSRMWI